MSEITPNQPKPIKPLENPYTRGLSESAREAFAANQRGIDDGRAAEETARRAREEELRALKDKAELSKKMDLNEIGKNLTDRTKQENLDNKLAEAKAREARDQQGLADKRAKAEVRDRQRLTEKVPLSPEIESWKNQPIKNPLEISGNPPEKNFKPEIHVGEKTLLTPKRP